MFNSKEGFIAASIKARNKFQRITMIIIVLCLSFFLIKDKVNDLLGGVIPDSILQNFLFSYFMLYGPLSIGLGILFIHAKKSLRKEGLVCNDCNTLLFFERGSEPKNECKHCGKVIWQ